jgi:exoribonuclease R
MARKPKYGRSREWHLKNLGMSKGTFDTMVSEGIDPRDAKGVESWRASRRPSFRAFEHSPSTIAPVDLDSLGLPPEFFEGRGLTAAIVRLEYLEQVTGRKVAEAVATNNPREIQNWIKAHESIASQLRISKKNTPAILKENGAVVMRSKLKSDSSKLMQGFVSRLQGIPNRAMQTCVGLDALDIREELTKEVNQCLEQLKEFLGGFQQEETQPENV